MQFSYIIVEVLTERERWLAKHTYLIEPCEALIALVRRGFIPTKDGNEWTLWRYQKDRWVEAWKGKIDASKQTKALGERYQEAIKG